MWRSGGDIDNMNAKKQTRGSITVESAIVLPIFICVVISLAMLIKLVYIHDIVQHSIDEAANELAAYSYIYHISDLQEIDDTIQGNLDNNSELAEGHIETVVDAFNTLGTAYKASGDLTEEIVPEIGSDKSLGDKAEKIINKTSDLLTESGQLTEAGINNIKQLQEAFEEVCKNPKKEAESMAWMLSKGIYSDSKTVVAVPLVKYTVKRYLYQNVVGGREESFNKLNIDNNFEGMDFYSSTFFDGDENIDIVVKYRIELPLPVKLMPDIYMVQRSTARAWLNGGDGTSIANASIWELPNKQRGMKIEEIYGGNLPYDFPTIDIYDNASKTGTSIKSINLNSKTYQDKGNLKKKLMQYVDALAGANSISYKQQNYEMSNKKLIVVIPKGSQNVDNSAVLEQIKSYADSKGIEITISELE